jgi:arylsulfatase
MKFWQFFTLVFAAATLIVGAAHLSNHGRWPQPVVLEAADLTLADHSFIAADRSEGDIECPVTLLARWGEIWETPLSPCLLADGWMLPEKSGSLVFGNRARIEIELANRDPRILALRLRGGEYLPDDVEQTVRIFANGHDLGRYPVSRNWRALRQRISSDRLLVGRNEITLEFEHAVSPRQVGIERDSRAIAAKIDRLALLTPQDATSAAPSGPTSTRVWDSQREAYAIRQSGTLVVPLLMPPRARRLEFDLQPSGGADPAAIKVVLGVEDLDGRQCQSASMRATAAGIRRVIGVPVEDLAGRWAIVSLDVSLGGGEVMISPPRVVSNAGAARANPPSPPPAGPRAQPDIVLITLDAAREDRFSFSGHHRKTTPSIDEIARESLVFPNAYALAPYTLCSVPTMLTGLSFLDHGVVRHNDVLGDKAVTLAESLQQRGYLTAGFSATPNNSKSKGFAQGYEVFREIWTEGPARQARRADFLARRVVDWLDSAADDPRPLHLQVHMIPPHSPYDPRPEFDVFSDPAYDGPCDGFPKTLGALDGREIQADLGCVGHLLDLYDGNLREADDATGIILRALQNRPRWENTVVLITSDHGEAFMEHGVLEHNSTVFGEMLHVPFVLKLPAKLRPHTIDTDRLVTLADIVPTLLGTAGITTARGGTGIDLLAPGTDCLGRAMVARTTTSHPFLGLRTLRWSLMLNGAGAGALFDLSTDPGELDNVSARQPARYTGLGKVLSHRIGLPARLVVSTESATITDDERSLLETLGYVRD